MSFAPVRLLIAIVNVSWLSPLWSRVPFSIIPLLLKNFIHFYILWVCILSGAEVSYYFLCSLLVPFYVCAFSHSNRRTARVRILFCIIFPPFVQSYQLLRDSSSDSNLSSPYVYSCASISYIAFLLFRVPWAVVVVSRKPNWLCLIDVFHLSPIPPR